MYLSSRFARQSPSIRSEIPLANEQIARVAPSIFAAEAHDSRSARYTYIPTVTLLDNLRREGFEPFFACQSKARDADMREHTKHMIRLRHANHITAGEANEIILVNSHNGSSSYHMLAGCFRFVCQNGLVCGDSVGDIRIKHSGNVSDAVIEGAYSVLESFARADESREGMKALTLDTYQREAFATAALALKYEEGTPAPITPAQVLAPRRFEDRRSDLWTVFNTTQENLIQGGLNARTTNGRRSTTRPVAGIDQNVKLNRALWILAEAMGKHLDVAPAAVALAA